MYGPDKPGHDVNWVAASVIINAGWYKTLNL
jgi:hypothetical protein